MKNASEIRSLMPTPQSVSFSGIPDICKDDLLHAWQLRMIRAAKEGAVSFWLKANDGYVPGKLQSGFIAAIEELKASGYHVVNDSVHGKPALRVYWGGKVAENIPSVPKRRVPALFYAGSLVFIASILPASWFSALMSQDLPSTLKMIMALVGMVLIFLFVIIEVDVKEGLESDDEPARNEQ